METSQTIYLEVLKFLEMLLKPGLVCIIRIKALSFFLLLQLMSGALIAQPQKQKSITYFIPNIVCREISTFVENKGADLNFYAIFQTQNDTTSILISTYKTSIDKVSYLVENSSRDIKISQNLTIPLVLHSDLLFSTTLHSVKNEGTSDETFTHTNINPGGYLIVYTGMYHDIKVLKAGYSRY